jgi:MYXO-CTERM domain-containing protein
MRAKKLFAAVAAALAFAATSVVAPNEADAAPGTCKCNSGCHANPGQCLTGSACNVGYAPACGFRSPDAGADCPKTDYISCNGTCSCTPIPGFCETIGGAEFCDAGPPDTGLPDTEMPDTRDSAPPDTEMPDTRDSALPDTEMPDTLDTAVPPDTEMPDTRDSALPDTADTMDTMDTLDTRDTAPVDACMPLECPTGTKTIVVAGECDPYCAQPCGGGEFKCAGLAGTVCMDGFCVPKGPDGGISCLTTGCGDAGSCMRCNLTDGVCFEDPTRCVDGGPIGDGGGTGDTSGMEGGELDATVTDTADMDTNPFNDTGSGDQDGMMGGDTSGGVDGDVVDTGGDGFLDPTADPDTQGGCGCSVPGNTAENTLAALASAAALAMVFARRRRKK